MSSTPSDLPKMQYRFLGRSGLQVSAIALGGWLTYGGHVENEGTFACMKAAYDRGINFFDCAEGYADGESERVMGQAIKKFGWKRNDLVISTKINWGYAHGTNRVNNGGLSRKHLIEGTKASLERLGLEYGTYTRRPPDPLVSFQCTLANASLRSTVDLLYAHRPDRYTPMEETVRAFNYLIDHGYCFYWGTSEWRADEIERAWAVADRLGLIGPIMEQPQYNLLIREKVESEFIGLYASRGLGITHFSPLKAGILTGKYNDSIPEDSRLGKSDDPWAKGMKEKFGNDDWQKEIEQVKKLKPVADKLGTDQAGLALAWTLKHPNVASAITGASKVEQIYKSVKSLDLLPMLTDDVMAEIDQILGNKPTALTMRF